MDAMGPEGGEKKEDLKTRLRKRLPPRRDPKLYEFADYEKKRGKAVVSQGRAASMRPPR